MSRAVERGNTHGRHADVLGFERGGVSDELLQCARGCTYTVRRLIEVVLTEQSPHCSRMNQGWSTDLCA
jgi:hypothetical protein